MHTKKSYKLLRVFWVILIIASSGVCVYFNYRNIVSYLSYEVNTVFATISKKTVFPSVSFCYYQKYAHTYKLIDQIVYCTFDSKNCNKTIDFEPFSLAGSTTNNCVRFNAYKDDYDLKMINSPLASGLYLSFYFPTEQEEMSIVFLDNYLNTYMGQSGYYASSSYITEFYFNKFVNKKLEWPYNNCTNKIDIKYRHKNCLAKCVEKLALDSYNCTMAILYEKTYLESCYNSKRLNDKVEDVFIEFGNICDKECIKECEDAKYDIYFMSSPFFNNNYLDIHVTYSRFEYMEVSETAKTSIFDLVSFIGGTCGLFLGMSFLSFVEIFEFFIRILAFSRFRLQNSVKPVNNIKY